MCRSRIPQSTNGGWPLCARARRSSSPRGESQFVTCNQTDWGSGGACASLRSADYETVFAVANGVLTVGVLGTPSEYYLGLTGAEYVLAYLPASGTAGPLILSDTDPNTTSAGIFAGDVTGLALNVDFNNAGFLHGTSSVPSGNLVLTNMGVLNLSSLDGVTVSQFLADANSCLGGGPCPLTNRPELGVSPLDFTDDLTEELNLAFGIWYPGCICGGPSRVARHPHASHRRCCFSAQVCLAWDSFAAVFFAPTTAGFPKSTSSCKFSRVIPPSNSAKSYCLRRTGSIMIRPASSRTSTASSRFSLAACIAAAGIRTAALLPHFLTIALIPFNLPV
jgi:hypothetical protein